jgi:hypothetical protein
MVTEKSNKMSINTQDNFNLSSHPHVQSDAIVDVELVQATTLLADQFVVPGWLPMVSSATSCLT